MNFSRLKKYVEKIKIEAKKSNKMSGFVIGTTAKKGQEPVVILPIRDTPYAVCGAVTVYTKKDVARIAKMVDHHVDLVFFDVEQKLRNMHDALDQVSTKIRRSRPFTFKGNDMTADAMDSLLATMMKTAYKKKIAVIGTGNIGTKVALKLVERGASVAVTRKNVKDARKVTDAINFIKPKHCRGRAIATSNSNAARNADALIGFTRGIPAITPEMVASMNKNGILIDGGVGTIYPAAIKEAFRRGIRVIRLDIRAGFAGSVTTSIETSKLVNTVMGSRAIRGVNVVAGGVIGNLGDVIVDNISKPRQVIGIADGKGGVLIESVAEKYAKSIKLIESWINKRLA